MYANKETGWIIGPRFAFNAKNVNFFFSDNTKNMVVQDPNFIFKQIYRA